MDIEIFTLCDYAEAITGKLIIVGAFDTIFANKLPTNFPMCTVTARIRYHSSEGGDTAIQLRITSPDNDNLIPPLRTNVNFPIKPGAESMSTNIVLTIQGLPIKTYARHSVTLSIHGQDLRKLPLFVVQPREQISETNN